ncbi:MAG TPA: glucosamine-6-phosphate deaminase [Chitinophagaceae bacterium]|nr:glucosamine-6-phosphate deaminase [Chitinophagaceae bacterium]
MTMASTHIVDHLLVKTYDSRLLMGASAAQDVAGKINELLSVQEFVNIIFAAAPSQNEFLNHLAAEKSVNWSRVNGFHMDEYVGLHENASQRFGQFLKEKIFGKASLNNVYYINGNAEDLDAECKRYQNLLTRFPPDIVCMGIGENTHIAFNDPHTADFEDPLLVKVVTLDEASRQQQVNDECFTHLEEVPTSAITLTVPALTRAGFIFCIVPGKNKALAVTRTINSEVTETYPATILRTHYHAILYLDKESAAGL